MPFIDANGERLHYTVSGQGPAVMLVHSMGTSGYMWRDQIAALEDRYTCIAFDCRGHGETSYNQTFDVAGVAADHKAGLDALGVETAHVIGLAMGGPIAISFAAQWPDATRSLIIADAFVDMREVGGARIPSWEKSVHETPMEEFGRQYAESRLMASATDQARKDMREAIAKVTPEAYIDTMHAIFDIEFTAELSKVRAPTLVIFGEEDEVTPRHHSEQIANGVSGGVLETIPNAGHIANIDQPAAFNRLMSAFLDAQPV